MENTETLRALPANQNAEAGVLSAMMIEGDALARAIENLSPEDFSVKQNRVIFRAMTQMFQQDIEVDAITLHDYLLKTGRLEEAGGIPYISQVGDVALTSSNLKAHIEIVKTQSIRRGVIKAGWKIAEKGFSSPLPADELLSEAEAEIYDIRKIRASDFLLENAVNETLKMIEKDAGNMTGSTSGFEDLDHKLGRMKPGQYIILAARPAMGKTALALEIARRNAAQGFVVAFFSLEQSREELLLRMVAQTGYETMSSLFIEGDYAIPVVQRELVEMSMLPIYLDDTAETSPLGMKAKLRRIKKKAGRLDLVIVDYLQLIKADGYFRSRYEEVSAISRSLKILAKTAEVPVIALAQLNRAVEDREDKRPRLSDLRDSGAIEQDADKVVFIYRDEVYNPDTTDTPGIADIIIRKNRNGRCGITSLHFEAKYVRFNQLEYHKEV